MSPLIFTHANTLREVVVTREHIFTIQYSAANKATHLLSLGGAIIPVQETVEQATRMVYGDVAKIGPTAKEK
jgi:hypothetical protein